MSSSAPSLDVLSSEIAALAAQQEQSVVGILSDGRTSSGYFWQPDVVVTASDALEAGKGEKVGLRLADGDVADARVLGHDPTTDVALIKSERTGQPVPFSSEAAPRFGTFVVALGRSEYGATCATGVLALVGAAWHSMRGGEINSRLWLDVRLPPHAEGGPAFAASGSLLGMAVFGPQRRTLVIPAETIGRAAAEIEKHGHVRRGYLGVGVQAVRVTGPQDQPGLMVVSLDENGPAREAGIRQGDILIKLAGSSLQSVRSLTRLLPGTGIGSRATVELVRAGENLSLEVMIGESPRA